MGNVFCYSAETLEKVMPIRTMSMIALTVYFDWIKEKAVWNGENVQLKASFQDLNFSARIRFDWLKMSF